MDVRSVLESLTSARVKPLVCVAGVAVAAACTVYLLRRLRGARGAGPAADCSEEASVDSGAEASFHSDAEQDPGSSAEPSLRCAVDVCGVKPAASCAEDFAPYRRAEYARHCPVLRRRARCRQRHRALAAAAPPAVPPQSQPVAVLWNVSQAPQQNCSTAAPSSFSDF
ncbi:hypothetical protein GN956_G13851 [Arapaima gigas]